MPAASDLAPRSPYDRAVRFDQATALIRALNDEAAEYVLVGSMAMAAHGIVRATQDIDFFISPDPENVDRVKRALHATFHDDDIDEITSADLAGPYPVMRYGPPDSELVIDLIARLGDAFRFHDIEWENVRVEDVEVRVATPRMLVAMKSGTVRPQDRVDADRIRAVFDLPQGDT
jgi:predicted nucleotidyltransferase